MNGEAWEYAMIKSRSSKTHELVETLNNAGAKGWEVISIADHDATLGASYSFLVIAKRKIVPFADPPDLTAGWKVDPSDRNHARYWDGEVWTFHVSNDGLESRDPPTQRTPAQRPQ